MKTLKSFGCSFIYGNELFDCDNHEYSSRTWPALIAKKLSFDYECYAQPGQGNFKIYCDILSNSYCNEKSVFLINWTWIDRFDYIDQYEVWQTLTPADNNHIEQFYYRHLHNQLTNMISSATYIILAAEHLRQLNLPYIMTFMDDLLFEKIDPNWHNPRYLEVLQQRLQKILVNFDGKNFINWSRANNYPISKFWHPLEDAHQAAVDYWLPAVKNLL
jgi:hypothetical protein